MSVSTTAPPSSARRPHGPLERQAGLVRVERLHDVDDAAARRHRRDAVGGPPGRFEEIAEDHDDRAATRRSGDASEGAVEHALVHGRVATGLRASSVATIRSNASRPPETRDTPDALSATDEGQPDRVAVGDGDARERGRDDRCERELRAWRERAR